MTSDDYVLAREVLRSGERTTLEELANRLATFPEGVDSFLGRRWILNAIDIGARNAVEWMLEKGVNLKGINDWTPAHLAAARDDVEALRMLVAHGADLTIRTEIDEFATPLEEARECVWNSGAPFAAAGALILLYLLHASGVSA